MSATPASGPERYDRTTIGLHWIVAVGVIAQWLGAHAIDLFAKGPPRVDARSVHILVGVTLLVLMGWRIWWRVRRGVRFAPDPRPGFAVAARLAHLALYGLLLTILVLGVLDAGVRGDSIFGLFHIPHLGDFAPAARHALAERIVALHELAANLLLWLAAGHAIVAVAHHVWLKDEILGRMLGERGRRVLMTRGR
jgi:cytochrome b561